MALHPAANLEKGIKQAQDLFFWNADAGIANAELQIAVTGADLQDDTAGVGKLDGVIQ
ncbi:hypothetical protein D3C75_1125770 [compost metagenome]